MYYAEIYDESYKGITENIAKNWDDWYDWLTKSNPQEQPLPGEWNAKLSNFEKLIILKGFRPEKLLFAF